MATYRSSWFSPSHYLPQPSFGSSSFSARSPSTSSSGSSDGSFNDFCADDVFGLKTLGFYAPYLEGEMERLFTSDVSSLTIIIGYW